MPQVLLLQNTQAEGISSTLSDLQTWTPSSSPPLCFSLNRNEMLLLFSLRIATETLLCTKEDFFLIKAQPPHHWHPIKQEWMFPTNYTESTVLCHTPKTQPRRSACLLPRAHEGWYPTPHSDKLRATLGSCSKGCGKGLQQHPARLTKPGFNSQFPPPKQHKNFLNHPRIKWEKLFDAL